MRPLLKGMLAAVILIFLADAIFFKFDNVKSIFNEAVGLVTHISPSLEKLLPQREQTYNFIESSQDRWNTNIQQKPLPVGATRIALEKVSNVGYAFYLGNIDTRDKSIIDDNLKQNITNYAYSANFPKNLLEKTVIILVNTLAEKPDTYIDTPIGMIKKDQFDPAFLNEGGFVLKNSLVDYYFIYLNKNTWLQGDSGREVLTHELGHIVGMQLSDAEWKKYYQIRNIPSSTPLRGNSWNTSPNEDFAEVFKNTITGLQIKTNYGILVSVDGFLFYEPTHCKDIVDRVKAEYIKTHNLNEYERQDIELSAGLQFVDDSRIQKCRQEVNNNPQKYPEEWKNGQPYKIKSAVSEAAREYIKKIVLKLNGQEEPVSLESTRQIWIEQYGEIKANQMYEEAKKRNLEFFKTHKR